MGTGSVRSVTTLIALHAPGPPGNRVLKALLAEPDLEIRLLHEEPGAEGAGVASGVSGCAALAVDAISSTSRRLVEGAVARGIPVVVGEQLPARYPVSGGAFVAGAHTGAGLAAAVALSMVDTSTPPVAISLAWTVPGRPLGAGTPVTFPEPVGPQWAGRDDSPLPWPSVTSLAAPVLSPWMGVAVRIRTRYGGGEQVRTVGIADEAAFLRGLCMASATLAAARGAYPPGVNTPGDPEGVFMSLARAAGLELGEFIPD